MPRLPSKDEIKKRRDFVFRVMEAKLVSYNVPYADEIVLAIRNLNDSPQRETIARLIQVLAKVL
jgi:hypothetical protein